MRFSIFLLVLLLLAGMPKLLAQQINDHHDHGIFFRSGFARPVRNIDSFSVNHYFHYRKTVGGKSFLVLQFHQLPPLTARKALQAAGIDLLDYIPENTFLARIDRPFSLGMLRQWGVESILELKPEQKMPPGLAQAGQDKTSRKIWVFFFDGFSFDNALSLLKQEGFPNATVIDRENGIAGLSLLQEKFLRLASLPFVKYISDPTPPMVPLAEDTRDNERANILQNELPGGYDLTGEGVTVGVLEFCAPQHHTDFADRLLEFNGPGSPDLIYHSTHVHGIVGGAGLVNELYTGYAPKARLLSISSSSVVYDDRRFTRDYQMVISNNSYGFGTDCNDTAKFYPGAYMADKNSLNFPSLSYVFSSGNSGAHTCLISPQGFHTILSGHQSAKSTIVVGYTTSTGLITASSSRGPTQDGRIKPEIVATGYNVVSTIPTDTYGQNSGSSMSAPAVSGGLALLYQEYRRLHGNTDPKSGLMKNIVCNTATDLGNPGPDFTYGFGLMNLLRAVSLLDSNQYITGNSTQDALTTHTVQVPPNVAQLKVMLYWQDPPGSLMTSKDLVNDLDLRVLTPSGATVLPFVLDTLHANLGRNATRGEDHINNIEQVIIDHPESGNYVFQVKGSSIPVSENQEYYISYDIVQNEVKLTYPGAGTKWVPGETATIQWDSWGSDASTYTLRFSADNGIHWQDIVRNLTSDLRQFNWRVPDTATDQAMFQIVRNADGAINNSAPFIIVNAPGIALSSSQCPGYINIQWPSVHGATDYEVMILDQGTMKVVATTTDTSYHFRNLSEKNTYWVTVRARIHGLPGLRATAIGRQPKDGTCQDPVSAGDLKADSVTAPRFGRKFTSLQLTALDTVRFRIRNLDYRSRSGFTVKYSLDSVNWITETPAITIPPDTLFTYTFTTPHDFSAPGNYRIWCVIKDTADHNAVNDTTQVIIRQLDNSPIHAGITDIFETLPDTVFTFSSWGLPGSARFDYINNSPQAKLGIGPNYMTDPSLNAVALDVVDYSKAALDSHYNQLVATYNLKDFDTARNDFGLSFRYSKSGRNNRFMDSLFIRGSDQDLWIGIKDLDRDTLSFADRKIDFYRISKWLSAARQNYSSSFQVSWSKLSGPVTYYFDRVTLFDQSNDVELKSLDSLRSSSYGLNSNEQIHITVRNNTRASISNLPVRFRIDGGAVVTETIPLIPSDSTITYTFAAGADLSAASFHTIQAWTDYPSDSYRTNDSVSMSLRNQPLITQFPYLENFERGDGAWFPDGANSSWALGKPASTLINGPASGNQSWKTNLSGKNNDNERSYLYSPYFDLTQMNHPAISFSLAMNTDSCALPFVCDGLQLQYTVNGVNWLTLLPQSGYDFSTYLSSPTYSRWHVVSNLLDSIRQIVQFRFWFKTDDFNNYDGVGLDDMHIYENNFSINDGPDSSFTEGKMISGGQDWIDFLHNGQVIASVNPAGQNLGVVQVHANIHQGKPRNFHGQYYLNRNLTIQSANTINDSVGIRLYFSDHESDSVIFAGDCPGCTKPPNAYRLGISTLTTKGQPGINDTLPGDPEGEWSFIDSAHRQIVPFDKGYYAEFRASHFSTYYFNNGGLHDTSYLPVQMSLTATRMNDHTAMLNWTTASEINIEQFDVQVAKGDSALQIRDFRSIGTVQSKGRSAQTQSYDFTDPGLHGDDHYYYRIRATDIYGHPGYSPIMKLNVDEEKPVQIYPNPSSGLFTIRYFAAVGELLTVNVYNSTGMMLKTESLTGKGYTQTTPLNLANAGFPDGVYFVKVSGKSGTQMFRLVKVN